MLADPTSPYARLAVMALNREADKIILAAVRGNARTNTGLTALPASQKIAEGGLGLTLAKLLAAKEILVNCLVVTVIIRVAIVLP